MIRWITENLGTGPWEEAKNFPDVHLIDVRDMVDKAGNAAFLVKSKVNEAFSSAKLGKKVIIACDYGISRSNTVAAGVLAKLENLPLSDAVRLVVSATGEKALKPELLAQVAAALRVDDEPVSRRNENRHRLLVTGGFGVLGTATISELANTYEIVAPRREEIDLLHDITDLDLIVKEKNIDCIIHFASPRIYTNNSAMGEILCMLKNVLDVCRANNLRLIYPSSWEVYSGYRSESLLASEVLPRFPKGSYGETKYLSEILIENHQHNYDIDYAIIRSAPVYGSGDRPKFIYNFVDKALKGEDIWAHRYLNGYPVLDLLHISDFVTAVKGLVASDICGAVNVGSGKGYSTTEVARMINAMLGSKSTVRHREIDLFAPNIVMDITRSEAILGWKPQMDFREGLSRILKSVGVKRH